MKNVIVASLLALGLGFLQGASAKPPAAAVAGQVEAKAVVESVDLSARQVLLSGDDGKMMTVQVGPEVRNLAQVKAGDHVLLRIRVGVLVSLAPADGAGGPVAQTDVEARTANGARPGAYAGEATRVRVIFNAYDAKTKTVNYTLPNGEQGSGVLRTKTMQNFAAGLKPADQVDVTFARSIAVAVTPTK